MIGWRRRWRRKQGEESDTVNTVGKEDRGRSMRKTGIAYRRGKGKTIKSRGRQGVRKEEI